MLVWNNSLFTVYDHTFELELVLLCTVEFLPDDLLDGGLSIPTLSV